MDIRERLKELAEEFHRNMHAVRQELTDEEGLKRLEEIRVHILGKKGELTALLRSMGSLSAQERPLIGALVNENRKEFEEMINRLQSEIENRVKQSRLIAERIDVTAPGKRPTVGKLHPITQFSNHVRDIFVGMGFTVEEGPEIEWVKYSFDMLNIPETHPARDEQDTFYINDEIALRPHTSPVQVRAMLNRKPPIRMICPGRVFRCDDVDATHSPVFYQLEGLVVDKGIGMSDLVGVLDVFAKELFGEGTKLRLRPSFFPFTEPSVEVDMSCSVCSGKGCRICKETGWIELLGAGMVHPNVLRMCNIDPEVYSGFAFGFGLDRMVNMKHQIPDIRLLYENDLRFLKQF